MKINLEDENIEILSDLWKNEGQLKEDIKGKIEAGDFDVVEETMALRELTTTLERYSKIEIKLTNDFIEKSHSNAGDRGVTFEEYLRMLLLG